MRPLRWKPEAPQRRRQRGPGAQRKHPRNPQRAPPRGRARAAAGPGRTGRVYKLENGKPVAVSIRVGIADGQRSEVLDGLAEGDQIIVGSSGGGAGSAPSQPQSRGGSVDRSKAAGGAETRDLDKVYRMGERGGAGAARRVARPSRRASSWR